MNIHTSHNAKLAPSEESTRMWHDTTDLRVKAAESREANEGRNEKKDTVWTYSWIDGAGLKASGRNAEALDAAIAAITRNFVPDFEKLRWFGESHQPLTSIHIANIVSDKDQQAEIRFDQPFMVGWTSHNPMVRGERHVGLVIADNRDALVPAPLLRFVVKIPPRRDGEALGVRNARQIQDLHVKGHRVPLDDEHALAHAVYFLRELKGKVGQGKVDADWALREASYRCGVPAYRALPAGNEAPPIRDAATDAKIVFLRRPGGVTASN